MESNIQSRQGLVWCTVPL